MERWKTYKLIGSTRCKKKNIVLLLVILFITSCSFFKKSNIYFEYNEFIGENLIFVDLDDNYRESQDFNKVWSKINKNFGRSIVPKNPDDIPTPPEKEIGPQFLKDGFLQGDDFAPEKPQTSFIKPSLALNALQRIGAAVSQSADPIAIEKDNNVLLKRIANNTKDIARNSE